MADRRTNQREGFEIYILFFEEPSPKIDRKALQLNIAAFSTSKLIKTIEFQPSGIFKPVIKLAERKPHLELPYARHYKPRLVYFLPHFSMRFIIKSC